MDDGLKQRIIGAVVLIALGVIFIPVLFDRERMEPVDKKTQIPPAPHIETIEIQKPKPIEHELVSKKPSQAYIPNEEQIVDEERESFTLDPQGVPKSWVLQVASFMHESHAKDMRNNLEESGFKSFVRTIETDKGLMRRVYVGPKINKNELLDEKKKIEKQFNMQTLLLQYKP